MSAVNYLTIWILACVWSTDNKAKHKSFYYAVPFYTKDPDISVKLSALSCTFNGNLYKGMFLWYNTLMHETLIDECVEDFNAYCDRHRHGFWSHTFTVVAPIQICTCLDVFCTVMRTFVDICHKKNKVRLEPLVQSSI